ncbi:MAG: hypothetical protein LBQ48_06850 [Oscillospiraceae bacterium]|nr:hypothetical protein [Oscillospiraceae bacterium]
MTYFQKNKTFNDEEHRKAWLINTTLNYCKRVLGSTWQKKTVPLEELSDQVFQFASEDENLVYIALQELPHKYRIILYLFYYEGLSVEEISKALKIKTGTIRMVGVVIQNFFEKLSKIRGSRQLTSSIYTNPYALI